MTPTTDKRFIFNATAVPFGGRIIRIDPAGAVDICIDDEASSALPVNGGCSKGKGEKFTKRVETPRSLELFSAEAYSSHAEGNHLPNGGTETRAHSIVKKAQVIERITVDYVECKLRSEHGPKDKTPQISPEEGTTIQGLRLDGAEVVVELDLAPLQKHRSKEEYQRYRQGSGLPPNESKGKIFGTIVKKMYWNGTPPRGAVIEGNAILWEDVGRIYVGEIFVGDDERRLTMLRIQLGSPIEGTFTLGEGQTNGQDWP